MSAMRATPAAVTAVLLVAGLTAPSAATPQELPSTARTVTRLVTLDSAPTARDQSPASRRANAAEFAAAQRDLLRAAGRAGIDVTVERRYSHVVNGLAVKLPSSQVGLLAALPGIASVTEPVAYEPPEPPSPASEDIVRKAVKDAAASGRRTRDGEPPSGREIVTVTDLTHVPEVHRAGVTGRGVTVGIVDSGIAYDHPALGGGGFPNAKVVGGHDFADDDNDPYDDAAGSAAGHGTHVAGIVAGSDEHIQGVAPDARLRAYRVFGSGGGASEEVVLAALDRAAADGVDIVNMSLGSPIGARASSVLSAAVDRLVESGTPVNVAAGNGYAGPFRTSAPAMADGAVAVGSTYSNHSPYLAFKVGDDPSPVPYTLSGRGTNPPSKGSAPYAVMKSSCDPLPEGSLRGKVALFTPAAPNGTGTICRPMDLARTAEAAGAVAAVQHDPKLPVDVIPNSPCCGTSDIPVLGIREADARRLLAEPTGTALSWGAYAGIPLKDDVAGLMDHGSAWGPGNELEFKPDIAAPGGYILSAMPKDLGWYGTSSGTSMAAPHITGVSALLLEKDPGLTPGELRTALQNTATPLAMTGDTARGAQPVAQQGAGRVDAAAAIATVTRTEVTATPAELPLKDLEGRTVTRHVTLRNNSEHPITYEVAHRAAISAAPPYTSEWKADNAGARVRVAGAERITLRPHKSRTVPVHFRQPAGVAEGTVFGGWIEFTPGEESQPTLRVPYQGLAGDFDAVSAINPTFSAINDTLDNPALQPAKWSFGRNLPLTVDLTDASTANDQAAVMLSHGFPLIERMRLQVLDSSGDVVATPYEQAWVTRNSGAGTGVDFYVWDATLSDGKPAPAGTYRLRLVFDKALGDRDHAPKTETWTSPDVTLVR